MVEKVALLSTELDRHISKVMILPAAQSGAWADPVNESLRHVAAEFARQETEMLRSVREAAQSATDYLHSSTLRMVAEFARQEREMLRSVREAAQLEARFDSHMGTIQAALDVLNNPMRQTVNEIAALSLTSPFPLPERRQVQQPKSEPESPTIEVVQITSADWKEQIDQMLTTGSATPVEMMSYLQSHPRRGKSLKETNPEKWAEIEAVALLYQEEGHKHDNQDGFAAFYGYKSSTFRNYLRIYKTEKGIDIRPGRGSSKSKPVKKFKKRN